MKIPVELLLHFQALTGRRRARLSVMDPAGVVAVFLVTAKGQILHERTLSNVEAGALVKLKLCLAELMSYAMNELMAGQLQVATVPVGDADSPVVFKRMDDVIVHVVGTPMHGHLELSVMLENVCVGVREMVQGRRVSEQAVLDAYGRVCLAVDEVLAVGGLDELRAKDIREGVELKELDK